MEICPINIDGFEEAIIGMTDEGGYIYCLELMTEQIITEAVEAGYEGSEEEAIEMAIEHVMYNIVGGLGAVCSFEADKFLAYPKIVDGEITIYPEEDQE